MMEVVPQLSTRAAIAGSQDRIELMLLDLGNGLVERKEFRRSARGTQDVGRTLVIGPYRQGMQVFLAFERLIRPDSRRRPDRDVEQLHALRGQRAFIERPCP